MALAIAIGRTIVFARWEKHMGEQHRYYQARVEKDLFGTWVLAKNWGRVDRAQGGEATLPFESQADAIDAFTKLGKRRISRGHLQVYPKQVGV